MKDSRVAEIKSSPAFFICAKVTKIPPCPRAYSFGGVRKLTPPYLSVNKGNHRGLPLQKGDLRTGF